ncbi:MAG: amino acid permease, partial [Acidimicrobiia bacterium]|nr:amino acid permease [Acidimicrobiia bacterium]
TDRIFPFLDKFSVGHGPTNNPRRGVLLSLVIALATVALGNLNLIAPIVSMFFLISYGLLNYATFFEARAKNPSFRPRFRFFHRNASLAGAVGCLLIIAAINITAGVVAVLVLFAIYQYLKSRTRPERWVDTTRAHLFQRARDAVQAMGTEPEHGRNWRPQVLVFSSDPARRGRLLEFATWIEGGSGFTVVAEILVGDSTLARRNREKRYAGLKAQIKELGLDTYPLIVEAQDVGEAIPTIIQSVGLGPMKVNTVLFNRPITTTLSASAIRSVSRLGANVVLLSGADSGWGHLEEADRRIDVWWFDNDSSRLALLLAYLCTRTETWHGAKIRVCAGVGADNGGLAELAQYLDDVRIPAEVVNGGDATNETVLDISGDAGLVMMPIRARQDELLNGGGQLLEPLFLAMPQMAGVLAGQLVELDAGPETGDISKVAEIQKAVADAENRAKTLAKVLDRTTARFESLLAGSTGKAADRKAILDAEAEVEEIKRRLLKAEARASAARAEFEQAIEP